MNNNVFDTVKKTICTGCGTCVQLCPQKALFLVQDEKGFSYPQVDNDVCTQCGLCLKKCHVLQQDALNHGQQDAYGFKHYVNGVRENSSSGGAFTLLSDYVLKNHGVVYGAVYSEDVYSVQIKRAETLDQRNNMRGAKYVQSTCGDAYPQVKEDLKNGRLVLFTGTPCQVAGLKKYLGNENCDSLILCDIFCHSVPSPKLFQDHIKLLERKKGVKAVGYSCREKRFGWRRRDCVYYADGSQDSSSMRSQLYYLLFNLKLANRPSCANCFYACRERTGDFSIGDFWGVEKSFKDKLGVSAILVNTDKGKTILNALDMAGCIQRQTLEQIFNRNHTKPIIPNPNTDSFWDDYISKGYAYVAKKYIHYTLIGKCVYRVKKIVWKVKSKLGERNG